MAVPLSRSQRRAPLPRVGDARSIEISEFAMNPADLLGRPVLRHEQRNLVPLIEIIEVHVCSRLRKREHGRSLSRVGLRQIKST